MVPRARTEAGVTVPRSKPVLGTLPLEALEPRWQVEFLNPVHRRGRQRAELVHDLRHVVPRLCAWILTEDVEPQDAVMHLEVAAGVDETGEQQPRPFPIGHRIHLLVLETALLHHNASEPLAKRGRGHVHRVASHQQLPLAARGNRHHQLDIRPRMRAFGNDVPSCDIAEVTCDPARHLLQVDIVDSDPSEVRTRLHERHKLGHEWPQGVHEDKFDTTVMPARRSYEFFACGQLMLMRERWRSRHKDRSHRGVHLPRISVRLTACRFEDRGLRLVAMPRWRDDAPPRRASPT
mmetsp:Transcript_11170/g.29762  ORF Transcript_11170/g.29762 Transcript_11170/m.29762 type:complete len:292 (+) Transcript_11170:767-1642(+)